MLTATDNSELNLAIPDCRLSVVILLSIFFNLSYSVKSIFPVNKLVFKLAFAPVVNFSKALKELSNFFIPLSKSLISSSLASVFKAFNLLNCSSNLSIFAPLSYSSPNLFVKSNNVFSFFSKFFISIFILEVEVIAFFISELNRAISLARLFIFIFSRVLLSFSALEVSIFPENKFSLIFKLFLNLNSFNFLKFVSNSFIDVFNCLISCSGAEVSNALSLLNSFVKLLTSAPFLVKVSNLLAKSLNVFSAFLKSVLTD